MSSRTRAGRSSVLGETRQAFSQSCLTEMPADCKAGRSAVTPKQKCPGRRAVLNLRNTCIRRATLVGLAHVRLFAAVLDGDHIARGFRNRDIRTAVFGTDTKDSFRRSAAVGRLLKRLHARQLVAKIPRTRRWRVTETGRHLLGLAVQLYRQAWPELMAA